jgi:hypothetical protein
MDEEVEVARFREVDKEIEEELMEIEWENDDDDDRDGQSTGELSAILSRLDLYMFIEESRHFHGCGPEDQTRSFGNGADCAEVSPDCIYSNNRSFLF